MVSYLRPPHGVEGWLNSRRQGAFSRSDNGARPMPYFLRFLGQPQLLLPDGEESRFRVRKHLALLLYLAVEARGIPHRRERLAELLWPNVTAGEGRHSLATALSVLRGKLGRESLETDRDHVRFVPANLALDLDRLSDGTVLGDEYTPPLLIAGFLEEFEIPDAPEFQLWRDRQWARWLPAIRDALRQLIDRCRRTGAFREMDRHAECLLQLDELSEDGIRARMEARAFEGDRLSALKLYEQWRSQLARELQAEPSRELEQMASRLRRRGWERVPTGASPAIRTEQWRGRPFLGRAQEYRRLYELWEATRRGQPSHALVQGDSGVGKTTLLQRVMTAAELEGAAVSRVQCYELEQEIPYAGLGTLVQGLLRLPGVSGTAPEWLAELARLQPEVRRRFPGIPDPPESLGETARLRLAEATFQLLTALAEDLPVILVLDDLHLADDATLAVLHLVLRRLEGQRIMMLAAARPAELDRSPNAIRLREGGSGARLALLDLPPMSLEESAALLVALVGEKARLPLATRRAILSAAAGYPMVLEYLVRDWQTNGENALALSLGAMTEDLSPGQRAGDAYRLILERLLRDLPASARTALGLAALLGSRLNDLEMYALADLTLSETMSGLARLTDLRVLRDSGRGLEFCNELLRAEAYLAVPSPLRRTLHGNIADRLLAFQAKDHPVPGLEIAWHCMRAGRNDEATPYLLTGAREAIRRGGPLEAERALTSAFDSLKGENQEEARLIWAEALQEQGRWAESLEVLGEPESVEPPDRFVLRAHALWHNTRYSSDLTHKHIETLIGLIMDSEAPLETRGRAAVVASYMATTLQSSAQTSSLINCLSQFVETADVSARSMLAYLKAYQASTFTRPRKESAVQEMRAAIAALESDGVFDSRLPSMKNGLGCMLCGLGRYAEAIQPFLEAAAHARGREDVPHSAMVASNLALCYFRLGDYERQWEWTKVVLDAHQARTYEYYIKATTNYAWALGILGRRSDGLALIQQEIDFSEFENYEVWRRQVLLLGIADALQALGESKRAHEIGRLAAWDVAPRLQRDTNAGPFSRWAAFAAQSEPERRMARESVEVLLPRLNDYDLIDQAGILAAHNWLRLRDGEPAGSAHQRVLRGILEKLPSAVTQQLKSVHALEADAP